MAVRKTPARDRKPSAENPARAAIRPPPPGQGKRGEQGYLAYLLRQAQAATRLAMERALADLGVTSPQFVVLTMLRAYPGLSGADLARVALLTPQTVGVIIRNLERDGAIRKTPHPIHGRVLQWTVTRRGAALLEQVPAPRRCDRAAAGGRALRQGPDRDPPLAGQNRRGFVRESPVPAASWLLVLACRAARLAG